MQQTKPRGFTRRNFIKGAAVLTAAGALAGCSPQGENLEETEQPTEEEQVEIPEETIFAGVCRGNCLGGCFLDVHVRDGQVVRTTARDLPDTRYNRICTRGITHVGRMYSAERLQYPMKRVGERGEGSFERISWDEAIDTVVERWKSITDEFGPSAMAFWTQSGNQGSSAVGMNSYKDRMRNVLGASTISMNFDNAHITAFMRACGAGFYCTGNEPTDLVNSKTIVCWGSNPPVSAPQFVHFINDARDAGARYIVIDPVFNANAASADWYIPINSATDGALAMGMIKYFFDNGWQDAVFLAASTDAPFLVKSDDGKFLRMSDLGQPVGTNGEDPFVVWDEEANAPIAYSESSSPRLENVAIEGGPAVCTVLEIVKNAVAGYSLETTSEITGIPVETIAGLAKVYHEEGPVYTSSLFGADHYSNGTYNYWAMYALLFVSGNMGKPGAGGMYMSLWPSHIQDSSATSPTDSQGNSCQGAGPSIPSNVMNEVIDTGTYAGEPLTVKGVFVQYTNPLAVNVDYNYMIEWLKKVDFIVVADMCMTETAKYADILLPVCHWFEQVEVFNSYGQSPYMLWNDKAAEPLYESKTDIEIYNLIAEGLGYGDFTCSNAEEWAREVLDDEKLAQYGFTFDEFKERKAARILPENYYQCADGTFPTATGRGAMYQEDPRPGYSSDQSLDPSKERTIYWEPAWEADVHSEVRATYPFHVISEHMRTRTHSQWWEVGYLKELESGPIVKINPDDAAGLDISNGDEVRLFNDRGSVVLEVLIAPGYPRGVVGVPRGFQVDEFIDGHYASLSPRAYSPYVANSICNDVAVAIEKA